MYEGGHYMLSIYASKEELEMLARHVVNYGY